MAAGNKGTILTINKTRDWYYISCTECTKKVRDNNGVPECQDHGSQPDPNYRYNFKASVTDNSATATFTFFTPNANIPTGYECHQLVQLHNTPTPNEFPPEILALEGKSYIFQFHYNPTSRKGNIDFIFDNILDEPKQIELPTEITEKHTETGTSTPIQQSGHTTTALAETPLPLQIEHTKEIKTDLTATPPSPQHVKHQSAEKSLAQSDTSIKLSKRVLFETETSESKKKKTE